jgi:two-component system nitrogen regulation response regulator NtrX
MSTPHILIVDDEPEIRNTLQEILEDEGYEVSVAENAASAREQRKARKPDLIMLDIWMPDTDGVSLLKEWQDGGGTGCPVVMISGHGTVETAVEATRLGAYDYIEKPVSLSKLLLTVEHALEQERLVQENLGLRRRTDQIIEPIGASALMATVRDQARRIAEFDTPVLLTGEPGCGKRTLAGYIHSQSARREGALIELGVHTLARGYSAVDLFGTEQGEEVHFGLLEQANGGVLFIDEVADLDLEAQGQLAATLEGHSYHRIGGNEPVSVDVRVIAATQRDLAQEVREGRFREQFYYQLNVVPLRVPPLREHAEDVPELLEFYVNRYVEREGLAYRHFSVAAQNRLRHYNWPGNVRELKNLVQRLLILGRGRSIELEEVEGALSAAARELAEGLYETPEVSLQLPLREARERFEREYLLRQLEVCGGKVGEVAKRVGLERTHLYRKLRSLNIDVKQAGRETQ